MGFTAEVVKKNGKMVNVRMGNDSDYEIIKEVETGDLSTLLSHRTVELGCLKFDFHSFRYTHETELSNGGVNIKEIQKGLGHSTMKVTSKMYLHATKTKEDEGTEKLN